MQLSDLPYELRQMLHVWKSRHGEIFILPHRTGFFVLRNFTLGEFERFQIQAEVDEDAASCLLLESCLLWPVQNTEGGDFDLDDLTPKDMELLLHKLREVSPYDNAERFLAKLTVARERAGSLVDVIYTHIGAAFPSMKMNEIRALSCDEIIHHLAVGEKILGRELEINAPGQVGSVPNVNPGQAHKAAQAQRQQARAESRRQRVREELYARAAAEEAAAGGAPPPAASAGAASEQAGPPPGSIPMSELMGDADDIRRALGKPPDV